MAAGRIFLSEAAATGRATGRMANTGQSCVASKRFFVPSDLYDAFVAGLSSALGGLKAGDPQDESTTLGPLSSEQAARDLEELVQDALDNGAHATVGGHRIDHPGAYFEPTELTGVTDSMRAFSEELFGPVASYTGSATPMRRLRRPMLPTSASVQRYTPETAQRRRRWQTGSRAAWSGSTIRRAHHQNCRSVA